MSKRNFYGIVSSETYYYPPSADGCSSLAPCDFKLFAFLKDSDYVTVVNSDAGQFLYDENGCLIIANIYSYQPAFDCYFEDGDSLFE